jgi:hypothetical protein
MAIAPIDLQTLFTQVDKVGKTQIHQKEGNILAQAVQGAQLQKKTTERIQEVNEAQNTGEGSEKVNDRAQREHTDGKKKEKEDEEKTEEKQAVFSLQDPRLGKRINISL